MSQARTFDHPHRWRKSSRSNDSGGECVEAARLANTIAVRDSKLPTTGDFSVLTMTAPDWTAFLATLRDTP